MVRRLRSRGIRCSDTRAETFIRILRITDPASLRELYWSTRSAFVTDREQIATFDSVFASIFRSGPVPASVDPDSEDEPALVELLPSLGEGEEEERDETNIGINQAITQVSDDSDDSSDDGDAIREELDIERRLVASSGELLSSKSFPALTNVEMERVSELIDAMRPALPERVSRRTRHRAGAGRVDIRGSYRRAMRTGGEMVDLLERGRRSERRRIVFLLDISGSMDSYVRPYLHLAYAVSRLTTTEVFTFSTRLTHVTRHVRHRNIDRAMDLVGRASPDWSSGTRIGDSLGAFNDDYGRRGIARGSVIVILSDGWERGDIDQLSVQIQRMRRLANRLVWVNPRKAADGYRPIVGGIEAVLPFCDAFVSGHTLGALKEVVSAFAEDPPTRGTKAGNPE